MRKLLSLMVIMLGLSTLAPGVYAEMPEVNLVIKDHKFEPKEVRVPAGKKVKLVVENQDPTPEEFESHELHREKIIAGNKTVKIMIGPLKPGRYPFFGEFHEDTARGVIIAE